MTIEEQFEEFNRCTIEAMELAPRFPWIGLSRIGLTRFIEEHTTAKTTAQDISDKPKSV
jgi:hypothetical protein